MFHDDRSLASTIEKATRRSRADAPSVFGEPERNRTHPTVALGLVGEVQLAEDRVDVFLHRLLAEVKACGNHTVAQSFRHQREDVAFAFGQIIER